MRRHRARADRDDPRDTDSAGSVGFGAVRPHISARCATRRRGHRTVVPCALWADRQPVVEDGGDIREVDAAGAVGIAFR